jgi:hemerythrin superfamily protein
MISLRSVYVTKLAPFTIRHHTIHSAAAMSTISAAITKDHRELKQYFNEVVDNQHNPDHQQRYGNRFIWEAARHSVGEELVVYPAFEQYLGAEGKQIAEEDRKEHHKVCTRRP